MLIIFFLEITKNDCNQLSGVIVSVHFQMSSKYCPSLAECIYSFTMKLSVLCFTILLLKYINFILESDEVSIPKLGDHKFATLAELLKEQDEKFKSNNSQSSMSQ